VGVTQLKIGVPGDYIDDGGGISGISGISGSSGISTINASAAAVAAGFRAGGARGRLSRPGVEW
jgi:hypothetical protein